MPTPKGYKHRKLAKSSLCAAGSFRRVRSGKALVTVCCPKGKWKKGRCLVGTRAVGLDVRLGDLKREAAKEHREHPWTTMAQARRIARDHARKRR